LNVVEILPVSYLVVVGLGQVLVEISWRSVLSALLLFKEAEDGVVEL